MSVGTLAADDKPDAATLRGWPKINAWSTVVPSEGTLDQFSRGGIMVFFNDPVPCPTRLRVRSRRRWQCAKLPEHCAGAATI
jgi:hypothetical protein